MTTQPTQNPVPSESPRDLKFNAGKIDEFVTSMVNTYIDRFGNKHYTIEGLRWLAQQAIANYGWILKDSFEDGYTITLPNEALLWESNGEYYRWDGALPKEVAAGSTPDSSGGVGVGAWVGIGDAALKTMLAGASGSSMIGMEAGGTLKDATVNVTAEQFDAEGDGLTDDTAAIQAAIDYVYAQGGGIVKLKAKTYRAANLLLKPRVVIEGVTLETSMIKAPDNWTGNAVIMGQGYLTYKTDSASQVVPGCFSAGVRNLTIHGNKSKYSGTPAKDVGCGLLLAGANLIIESLKIIYIPSVGLVTLDWGTNRALYQAADPARGWAHIGRIRNIRIQFCGNDCWHCEAQDYFLDDVEIVGAGDGFSSTSDTFSFWQSDELVSNFRAWRNIDIGFLHTYGNYNGYGLVFGSTTTTFFIRVHWDQIIAESCLIAAWFRTASYVQGGRFDLHEISQHKSVAKHNITTYPPALIIDSNNSMSSDYGAIHCIQKTTETGPGYSSIGLYVGGARNVVQQYIYSRSPTVSAALTGTGLFLNGADHVVKSAQIKGVFGTDSNGNPSSCIVNYSGTHRVNAEIGYANVGVRSVNGELAGDIFQIAGNTITTWQMGVDSYSSIARSRIMLRSTSGGNSGTIKSAGGSVSSSTTSEQTVTITGLYLPYIPATQEVSPQLCIDAVNGSVVYPQLDYINYDPSRSTTSQLVFVVKLKNSNSPMQLSIAAKLN